MIQNVAVWWLDEPALTSVKDGFEVLLQRPHPEMHPPDYLRREVNDAMGRPGRGRLWVAAQFGRVAVNPWPETEYSDYLGKRCAGIVTWKNDAIGFLTYGGIVTDTALTLLGSHPGMWRRAVNHERQIP